MARPRAGRRRIAVLAAAVAALVPVIAACGGSSSAATTTQAAASTSSSGSTTQGTTSGSDTTRSATTTSGTTSTGAHTVFCGTVAGQPWSTNGKTGTQWDVSAMGVACATATHWVTILSAQNAIVLNGPSGYKCYANVVDPKTRPTTGSCTTTDGSQNFTWQAAAY